MDMEYNYKVCTLCETFNQAKYIVETMNGFCMQETSFPVVNIIVDDASSDGEQEIINNYLRENFVVEDDENTIREETDDYQLIYTQHKNNKNCCFVVLFLKYNHYGKKKKAPYYEKWAYSSQYLAICEGDDYWTDPLKLQKQVFFLDANKDYSMCFTDVQNYYEDKHILGKRQGVEYAKLNSALENRGKNAFYDIILGKCRIQTLTVVLRKELLALRKPDPVSFMMGDTQLWLDMSQLGNIKYIPDCTGVYRIRKGSASNNPQTSLLFKLSMFEMRIYYCEKYGKEIPAIIKKQYNRALIMLYVKGITIGREPLYKVFPMGIVQNFVAKNAKSKMFKWFVLLMFWYEQQKERLLARIG